MMFRSKEGLKSFLDQLPNLQLHTLLHVILT